MRSTLVLAGAIFSAALVAVVACGGSGDSTFGSSGGASSGDPGPGFGGDSGGVASSSGDPGGVAAIASMRIEPESATLDVDLGQTATKSFRVLATLKGGAGEVDITSRSVFYTPAGYLVGTFPANGGPTFTTRLPNAQIALPQRGGVVTVRASAANADETVTSVETTLTVRLRAVTSLTTGPESTPPLPANPGAAFAGTPSPAHAPAIYYPNPGVMLPPNLKRLEVHWKKGDPADKLFEVSFQSASASLVLFTRCTDAPTGYEANALEAGSCAIRLDEATYDALAESNRGRGPVTLKIRGADEAGAFGESATQTLELAENRVDGGVYYWTASDPPRVMRFDFGTGAGAPEPYLVPSQDGLPSDCVGCHALSRDGTKLFAGVGNSSDGRLVFIKDVKTKALTVSGASSAPANTNRVLLGSFDPTGAQFVAVAPRNDAEPDTKLMFHDTANGLRKYSIDVGFVASHPDWSPDGKSIAVTRISGSNASSIEFFGGGIDLLSNAGAWQTGATLTDVQLVAPAANKNRYNPSFFPDGSLLLYSEVSCDGQQACNGYSDPTAKTWVVEPKAGASPIVLANAGAPGKNDGAATSLMDTFARATPFKTDHRGGKLLWFTVSSQRRAGLRRFFPNPSVVGDPATQQTLWMFAVDPAKATAGQDPSAAGFFLPFQDMTTSNHMATWTEKIVSDVTPPPPVPLPLPPPAPAPPIPR